MSTATATRKTTLITRYPSLRITLEPGKELRNDRGVVQRVYQPVAIEFEGPTALIEDRDGTVFVNNKRLQDPNLMREDEKLWTHEELLEHLRAKPKFNVDFYEKGNAPDEPKPTIPERQAQITHAMATEDFDALASIEDDEKATHNRGDVLTLIEATRDALNERKIEDNPKPEQSQGATPVAAGVSDPDGGASIR